MVFNVRNNDAYSLPKQRAAARAQRRPTGAAGRSEALSVTQGHRSRTASYAAEQRFEQHLSVRNLRCSLGAPIKGDHNFRTNCTVWRCKAHGCWDFQIVRRRNLWLIFVADYCFLTVGGRSFSSAPCCFEMQQTPFAPSGHFPLKWGKNESTQTLKNFSHVLYGGDVRRTEGVTASHHRKESVAFRLVAIYAKTFPQLPTQASPGQTLLLRSYRLLCLLQSQQLAARRSERGTAPTPRRLCLPSRNG